MANTHMNSQTEAARTGAVQVLVGRRTGVRYRLGDKVKVQVARCDIAKKMLDFALLDDEGNPYEDRHAQRHGGSDRSRGSKKKNPKGRTRSRR